jgi:hypothetical protein
MDENCVTDHGIGQGCLDVEIGSRPLCAIVVDVKGSFRR